jgi:CheY-like chemotaxis protein
MSGAAAKGGRVLVVDDEPMVRDTLGQVLADEGYIVDVAVDGEDALDRVHAARPDAILLDLMMPIMDGFAALQALRDDERTARIPVVVLSAVSKEMMEQRCLDLGARSVVRKPFDTDELLIRLDAALDASSTLAS